MKNKIDFKIRQETATDHQEVYDLIKTAFETAEVKDGDEQDFAVSLRNGENFIPDLSLVAELNGRLIGHIMFTKTVVAQPDGSEFEGLLVSPLSVLPEYRNLGVGSTLMKEGLEIAEDLGFKAAFLCGNPRYYNRFGFTQTSNHGIRAEHIPEQFVLVCEIIPYSLQAVSGVVHCC